MNTTFDFSKLTGANTNTTEAVMSTATSKGETTMSNPTIPAPQVRPDYSHLDFNTFLGEISTKLKNIEGELNSTYVEREKEIRMLILAFISGTNAFLHGPAGTGKSQLVEDLSDRVIDSNYYRVLMGKTTEPAEVFGPVSINALKNDVYKVNTENKLPTSHIAFLDEVFKANSAVLNSLLTIMNEKLFFNDVVEHVPTISVVGASNEFPEEESLTALYDRFLLRWNVSYIQDHAKRMNLFNNFLNSRKVKSVFSGAGAAVTTSPAKTVITLEDLMAANELCKEITISNAVLKDYNKIFVSLEKHGIVVSDRRKNEALKVVQASAVLAGRSSVSTKDFAPLVYVFWNTLSDIQIIADEINAIANPNQIKYDNYMSTLQNFRKELDEIEETKDSADYELNKSIKITEINKTLTFAVGNLDKIISGLDTNGADYNDFIALRDDMLNFTKEVQKQILI